jgi:hypothetical protein
MNHKNKEVEHFRQSYQGSQMLDSGRVQEFAMDTQSDREEKRAAVNMLEAALV